MQPISTSVIVNRHCHESIVTYIALKHIFMGHFEKGTGRNLHHDGIGGFEVGSPVPDKRLTNLTTASDSSLEVLPITSIKSLSSNSESFR